MYAEVQQQRRTAAAGSVGQSPAQTGLRRIVTKSTH
jgi:hypothetical protein